MKRQIPPTLKAVGSLALLSCFLPCSSHADDSDIEVIEGTEQQRRLADSTVVLVEKANVLMEGGEAKLKPWGGVEWAEKPAQPSVGHCSGSLVGTDLVLTARHCVEDGCGGYKFVFGYRMKTKDGPAITNIPVHDVYDCKDVAKQGEGKNDDWALVRLDRKVDKHPPLLVNMTDDIATGSKLFIIGYPVGLPAKIHKEGKVTFIRKPYLIADTHASPADSGAAAFNAETNKIEAIVGGGGNASDVHVVPKKKADSGNAPASDGKPQEIPDRPNMLTMVMSFANDLKALWPAEPADKEAKEKLAPKTIKAPVLLEKNGLNFDGQ